VHLLQRVNTSGLMWNRTLLSLMEDSHLLMLIGNISLNHYQCVDIYGIMTCVNVHVLMVSASRSAGHCQSQEESHLGSTNASRPPTAGTNFECGFIGFHQK